MYVLANEQLIVARITDAAAISLIAGSDRGSISPLCDPTWFCDPTPAFLCPW